MPGPINYWSITNPRSITLEFDGILHPPLPMDPINPAPHLSTRPLPTALPLVTHLLTYNLPILVYSDRANFSDGTGGIQAWLKHHGFPRLSIGAYLRPIPQTWFISARALPVLPPDILPGCFLPTAFPLYSWEASPTPPPTKDPVLTSTAEGYMTHEARKETS
jgi:hypothetical protein